MGRNGENGFSGIIAAAQAATEVDGEPHVEDTPPLAVADRQKPREARELVLDSMKPEEQAETIRRAERVGPGMDDSDWLIAAAAVRVEKAADRAADRIEKVVAAIPAAGSGKAAGSSSVPVSGRSLFDQCLDLCSSHAEKEKLKSLAIRLHLAENDPNWVIVILHAESRAIFGPRQVNAAPSALTWRHSLADLVRGHSA